MQPVYALALNGHTLLEVSMPDYDWLPCAPRLRPCRIRFAIRDALARALSN